MSNNPTAFPVPMAGDWPEPDRGMTLRDYFAARAMQGILSNPDKDYYPKDLACESYELADAMLIAREAKAATGTPETSVQHG